MYGRHGASPAGVLAASLFPSRPEPTIAITILFVYGTLKRGQGNHRLLAGQHFLGEATTEPHYRVIDLGSHPALIVDEANGLAVAGELWEVDEDCLRRLDEFEDVPGWFDRRLVAVAGYGLVDAYFWNRPVPAGAASGREWPPPG